MEKENKKLFELYSELKNQRPVQCWLYNRNYLLWDPFHLIVMKHFWFNCKYIHTFKCVSYIPCRLYSVYDDNLYFAPTKKLWYPERPVCDCSWLTEFRDGWFNRKIRAVRKGWDKGRIFQGQTFPSIVIDLILEFLEQMRPLSPITCEHCEYFCIYRSIFDIYNHILTSNITMHS